MWCRIVWKNWLGCERAHNRRAREVDHRHFRRLTNYFSGFFLADDACASSVVVKVVTSARNQSIARASTKRTLSVSVFVSLSIAF